MNIEDIHIGDVVTVCDRAGRRRHDGVIIERGEDTHHGPFALVMSFHDEPFDIAPYPWPLAELRAAEPARTISPAEIARLTKAAGTNSLLYQHISNLLGSLDISRAA